MKISDICKQKDFTFSLEIFPPKKDKPVESVYPAIERLSALKPDYISVTYGAGGSLTQQQLTLYLAKYITEKCGITALSHITCINSDTEQVDTMLNALERAGIENVLALRGDRSADCEPSKSFLHSTDLIAHIAKRGFFDIAAACYPEGHPDSESLETEIEIFKLKQDLGASHLVSQLFFDNADFYKMRELCQRAGVIIPIQAGIMPVTNVKSIERMVSMCGSKIPARLSKLMARFGGDSEAIFEAGLCYACEQIADLIANGVSGVHIYTMNNPVIAETIYGRLKSLIASANGKNT